MLTPQNKTQNLLLWLAAFIGTIILSFLVSLSKQLPGDAPINWRIILLDVISNIVLLAPAFGAGLGLPRIGGEKRAALIDEIGREKAEKLLETAAQMKTNLKTDVPITINDIDYGVLANEILKRKREEDLGGRKFVVE